MFLGYPLRLALASVKENKQNNLVIMYFFLLGVFGLLEMTVLFPVRLGLNMLCSCSWQIVKALLSLWLLHPTYRGALFVQQLAQPHIVKNFPALEGSVGKVLGFVGIPSRKAQAEN